MITNSCAYGTGAINFFGNMNLEPLKMGDYLGNKFVLSNFTTSFSDH